MAVVITDEMKMYFLRVMQEYREVGQTNGKYIDIIRADIERFPTLAEFDADGKTPGVINVNTWQIEVQ
jgi:hypothetical protein